MADMEMSTYGYGADSYGQEPEVERIPRNVTLNEYFKFYAPESFYKTLKTVAIGLYVVAGINAVLLLPMAFNLTMWVDVLILVAIGFNFQVHRRQSAAYGLLIYSVINILASILPGDGVGELALLIMGIISVKTFGDAKKEYEKIPKSSVVVDEDGYGGDYGADGCGESYGDDSYGSDISDSDGYEDY